MHNENYLKENIFIQNNLLKDACLPFCCLTLHDQLDSWATCDVTDPNTCKADLPFIMFIACLKLYVLHICVSS